MSQLFESRVLAVHHWTDTLFSLVTTRDAGFRFDSGQFTMIGLQEGGRPLLRAYSMVSAPYDDHLEFLSIKVPEGKLTSRLRHLREGDAILVGRKPTGTLVAHHLRPGRNLFLLSTGTGLAPFMSLIRDPALYEQFDSVVLTHTCRQVAELAYRDELEGGLHAHPLLGEEIRGKLRYYPTVTREPFRTEGRITALIESGQLFSDLGRGPFDPAEDRVMLCGSPSMLADCRTLLEASGLRAGSPGAPGEYIFEKAFAEG